ncbi:MAG: hypothetical protein OXR62_10345 [Ahrensia sp.]|nr:hypothetical protein [Ahrensia sp.]
MSLADAIPDLDRAVGPQTVLRFVIACGLAFFTFIALLFTMEKLGLSGRVVSAVVTVWAVFAIAFVSWFGRSVSGAQFFRARGQNMPFVAGLGGAFGWLSASVIFALFALDSAEAFILLAAVSLAFVLQAVLFAHRFGGCAHTTLPDMVLAHCGARASGLATMLACLLALAPLALAEFKIAASLLTQLSGLSAQSAMIALCVIATVPTLLGGWQSLIVVNACLGLWILLSLLSPAVLVGFLPTLLTNISAGDGSFLAPIDMNAQSTMLDLASTADAILLLIVNATGIAAFPHLLARLPLAGQRIASIEGLAWSSLIVFLALSALLLSVGLVLTNPSSTEMSVLLQSNTSLAILPYAALLWTAINALSMCLLVASQTLVLSLRARIEREPGVGSMFAARLVVMALSITLWVSASKIDLNIIDLLILAVAISASSVFPSLLSAAWFDRGSATFTTLCTLTSSCLVGYALLYDQQSVIAAAALGLAASLAILALWQIVQARNSPQSL